MKEIEKKEDQNNALSKIDLTGNSLTMAMHSGLGIASPFTREIFLKEQLPIVGMRYQGGSLDLLREIQPGSRITFMREPENHYDQKAIMALDGQGRKLGYISRYENEVLSALMDAGKTLYGIVSHIPRSTDMRTSGPPTVLYVNLYMREFAAPDDLSQIPLQGYRGSYVVMDLELTEEEEDAKIQSVFAIRVINGEERGILSEEVSDNDYEKLIRNLWEAVGYLPVVLYDGSGRQQEALENGWGIYAGRPFSNQVIEICEMARNHIPEVRELTLEHVTERLGIDVEGETPAEIRCRQIWKIYCRFDRSELEKRQEAVPEPWLRKKYRVTLTTPVSELRMTQRLREILSTKEIDILWEVSILSYQEACDRFGKTCMDELEELLSAAGATFRPAETESLLYGYPKRVHSIVEEKGPTWKISLYTALFKMRYKQLQKVRKLNEQTGQNIWIEDLEFFQAFAMKETKIMQDTLHQLHEALQRVNTAFRSEDDECVREMCGVVDDLIRGYKQLMAFTRRVRKTGTTELYRDVIDGLVELGEYICKEAIDEIFNSCELGDKRVEDYLAGKVGEEALSISVSINVDPVKISDLIWKVNEIKWKQKQKE